jgi:hypothetical protein
MNDLHSKIQKFNQELEQVEMEEQMENEKDKLIIAFYCFRKKEDEIKNFNSHIVVGVCYAWLLYGRGCRNITAKLGFFNK